MIFILFIILFLLMFIAYILNGKDILSPFVIVCAMFLFSVFICILNITNWNISLNPVTVLIIILGVFFFGVGETTSRIIISKLNFKQTRNKLDLPNNENRFEFNIFWMILIYVFMSVTVILYFYEVYRISIIGGNKGGYDLMLNYARSAMLDVTQKLEQSRILEHARIISQCITYFFVFIFMYNCIFYKFKFKDIKYIIPIPIYCLLALLSTGRTAFIYLIVVILMTSFIFLKKKYNWSYKYDFKIVTIGSIIVILFLIVFYFLGTFTGKAAILSLKDTISIYAGSSIVAFDIYLDNEILETQYFGKETLFGVYAFLRKFGIDLPSFRKPLEFVEWQNGTTNIYTSFRRYIQDYSYMGLIIIQFVLGILYGGGMAYIRRSSKISFYILFYVAFFYPIIECAIEERFLSNLINTGTIYQILYMIMIYYFFITRNNKVHFKI